MTTKLQEVMAFLIYLYIRYAHMQLLPIKQKSDGAIGGPIAVVLLFSKSPSDGQGKRRVIVQHFFVINDYQIRLCFWTL